MILNIILLVPMKYYKTELITLVLFIHKGKISM
jgi:hypothetical protein